MAALIDNSTLVAVVPNGEPFYGSKKFCHSNCKPWFDQFRVRARVRFYPCRHCHSRSRSSHYCRRGCFNPWWNIFWIFIWALEWWDCQESRRIARIMLMNFLLFSLIMRTAYQSKYFEFMFMNKAVHKKETQMSRSSSRRTSPYTYLTFIRNCTGMERRMANILTNWRGEFKANFAFLCFLA